MMDDMNISEMLAEQLDKLFGDVVDRDLFIEVEKGNPAQNLWQEIENLGITYALVSEEAGGAGLSWEDAEPSLRALGRHGSPVPLGETLLAHWVLSSAGIEAPTGPIAVSTVIYQLDDNNTVTGSDSAVAWAPSCENMVLLATRNDECFVCLVSTADATLTAIDTLAREPQASVALQGAPAQSAKAPLEFGEYGLLSHMAIIRTVQIGGAMENLLSLCVEYGNTREQFGRTIGKFQVIQHSVAQLASHTAAAQVAGLFACRQIDSGKAVHGAMVGKSRAGQSASRGAEVAHQVFAAIGFTDEHILHYFTRRLWQWQAEAGSEFWWAERLGEQVIANGGDKLWASIAP